MTVAMNETLFIRGWRLMCLLSDDILCFMTYPIILPSKNLTIRSVSWACISLWVTMIIVVPSSLFRR